jgi:hypothetical protein
MKQYNRSYGSLNISYKRQYNDVLCNIATMGMIVIVMPVIISLIRFIG